MTRKLYRYIAYSHKTWDSKCRNLGRVWADSQQIARAQFEEQGLSPAVVQRALGDSSYRLVDDMGGVIEEYIYPHPHK